MKLLSLIAICIALTSCSGKASLYAPLGADGTWVLVHEFETARECSNEVAAGKLLKLKADCR